MALNISVPIALFVFFLFAGLVHPLLGLIHRQLSLQRAELGVVFIMVMMAATVPNEGFVEHLLPNSYDCACKSIMSCVINPLP